MARKRVRQAVSTWQMQSAFMVTIWRMQRRGFYSFASQADFLVRIQSIGRTQPKKSIKITQVIESKARAEHRPGSEEEKIRAFERMQILMEGRKS